MGVSNKAIAVIALAIILGAGALIGAAYVINSDLKADLQEGGQFLTQGEIGKGLAKYREYIYKRDNARFPARKPLTHSEKLALRDILLAAAKRYPTLQSTRILGFLNDQGIELECEERYSVTREAFMTAGKQFGKKRFDDSRLTLYVLARWLGPCPIPDNYGRGLAQLSAGFEKVYGQPLDLQNLSTKGEVKPVEASAIGSAVPAPASAPPAEPAENVQTEVPMAAQPEEAAGAQPAAAASQKQGLWARVVKFFQKEEKPVAPEPKAQQTALAPEVRQAAPESPASTPTTEPQPAVETAEAEPEQEAVEESAPEKVEADEAKPAGEEDLVMDLTPAPDESAVQAAPAPEANVMKAAADKSEGVPFDPLNKTAFQNALVDGGVKLTPKGVVYPDDDKSAIAIHFYSPKEDWPYDTMRIIFKVVNRYNRGRNTGYKSLRLYPWTIHKKLLVPIEVQLDDIYLTMDRKISVSEFKTRWDVIAEAAY